MKLCRLMMPACAATPILKTDSTTLGHFLENGHEYARNLDAPYVVLPLPYERSVSFGSGTAQAPKAILAASEQLELFDEELCLAPGIKVRTLPAPDCESGSEAEVLSTLEKLARQELSEGRFLLSLGGEHTVTAPLVRAASEVYPGVTVLHLDAHLDLRDQYEGNAFSHACVMRRVLEQNIRIVHVGMRSLCEEEYRLVKDLNLPVFWGQDIILDKDGLWMKTVVSLLGRHVYLSLDVDVLETSVMPGTGTPEPGGLSWYQVLKLLRLLCRHCQVVAADIVETVPVPGMVVSEYTAAKLAAKLLAYHKYEGRKIF